MEETPLAFFANWAGPAYEQSDLKSQLQTPPVLQENQFMTAEPLAKKQERWQEASQLAPVTQGTGTTLELVPLGSPWGPIPWLQLFPKSHEFPQKAGTKSGSDESDHWSSLTVMMNLNIDVDT